EGDLARPRERRPPGEPGAPHFLALDRGAGVALAAAHEPPRLVKRAPRRPRRMRRLPRSELVVDEEPDPGEVAHKPFSASMRRVAAGSGAPCPVAGKVRRGGIAGGASHCRWRSKSARS